MPALPKYEIMESFKPDFHGGPFDIIEAAFKNDFAGVDRAVAHDPECINAQRKGTLVSALMVAASGGLSGMVSHLLAKPGIDLDLKDCEGKTALDYGRIFPDIVDKIMTAKYPNKPWIESRIRPAP